MFTDKKYNLYLYLNAIFITFLLMAELTGSKLVHMFGFTMTMGVIPFPVTFLITDTMNEFYGQSAVKKTTYIGMVMILFAYILILIDLSIPAIPDSPVSDESFQNVFANSGMVIVGSIIAYLIGQLIDIKVFHYLRLKTGGRHIWLRATGSTIISQLIDSYVVIFIAFSGKMSFEKMVNISSVNFVYKLLIAIALTPVIYLIHNLIISYLGEDGETLIHSAEQEPL
ncbi:MAG: queuosine precursor transporter [Leptospiraceae bacterium]|nr:queuosine precursor transporter [Leptospiraceae bacterium]MCP5511277.1 queuosine precursor transporter [Leptospiraceae bacterium]